MTDPKHLTPDARRPLDLPPVRADLPSAPPPDARRQFHDKSNTVQAANVAQLVVIENLNRRELHILNCDPDADLWVQFGGVDAVIGQPSVLVAPRTMLSMEPPGFVTTDRVTAISAVAGIGFTVKEA